MTKKKEIVAGVIFALLALISFVLVILICLFLFSFGIPAIFKIGVFDFILGKTWQPSAGLFGILPMIVGSILVTLGAVILGAPIGILCAVFTAKYCPKKFYNIFSSLINLLAGVPSIIFGFFGLILILPIISFFIGGSGKSILAASILLAIMILPTIILVSEAQIRQVQNSYFEGALALGATKERAIFTCVLKACKTGIISAVCLGVGRAIGETMAVVMIAGNQALIPSSITDGIRTLTSNIVLEMGYATGLHKDSLIATGVILFVFILILNIVIHIIKRKERKA